jgi:hypothetical protein
MVMASVTPVMAGTSDLFKSDTAPASPVSPTSAHGEETPAESALANDSVQLSLQALQLLETSRLLESAGSAAKAFNAASGMLDTQESRLAGPITLAAQPELAAALEQAYGLSSGQIRPPFVRARRPVAARPKGKNPREKGR